MKKYHYLSVILPILSLFGCNSPNLNEAIILFDRSDQIAIKNLEKEKVAPFLLNEVLELDDNDLLSQGVNITISSIGSTSIQYTESVALPTGGSFLSRTEKNRKEEIENFKSDISKHVQMIAIPSKELSQTVLMHNLCEHLNTLATSKASKKSILIWSDMLHNTSEVSFYHYRNNPSQILEHYENLAAKMDKICLLPSLYNITVTIVYLPTEKTDRLFQAARTFWSKYLQDYGAEVNFLPNI